MAMVNKLIGWLSAGALLGLFAASLLAPGYLRWNNTPGTGQALCDCAKVTHDTATELLALQAEAATAGGVVFLAIGAGALVLGIVELVRIGAHRASPRGRGRAIAGIVVGVLMVLVTAGLYIVFVAWRRTAQ